MEIQMPKTLPKVKFGPALEKSKVSWIEVALLIIIIALVSWFLVLPKQKAVGAQNTNIKDSREALNRLNEEVEVLTARLKQLKGSQKDIKILDEGLPLSGRVTQVHMLLQGIANSSGLSKSEVNVSGKGDTAAAGDKKLLEKPFEVNRSVQKLSASVAVSGSFENLLTFLKKTEKSGRLLDITAFEISPGQRGELEMKLNVDAYYFGI